MYEGVPEFRVDDILDREEKARTQSIIDKRAVS